MILAVCALGAPPAASALEAAEPDSAAGICAFSGWRMEVTLEFEPATSTDWQGSRKVVVSGRRIAPFTAIWKDRASEKIATWFAYRQHQERPTLLEGGMYLNERAAYLLSDHLRLGLVPPTYLCTLQIGGRPAYGSLQVWKNGWLPARAVGSAAGYRAAAEKLLVLDILTGNSDRNQESLVADTAARTLVAVDNGAAFPLGRPPLFKVPWVLAGQKLTPLGEATLRLIDALTKERLEAILAEADVYREAAEAAVERLAILKSSARTLRLPETITFERRKEPRISDGAIEKLLHVYFAEWQQR